MNREFLHKITILGCLFLLITSSSGTDNGFQTPEQYAQIVQEHFANEEWEAGKELLEEGLQKYPNVSDLEWLMGKYWFHEKNYDQSRYHLVKAIDDNYNNVNAKHLLVDVEDITENYSSAICYVNELLEVNPYWRGLWRRKIELYRKQNNDVEADRLLKRINQIYPNDTILRKDYILSLIHILIYVYFLISLIIFPIIMPCFISNCQLEDSRFCRELRICIFNIRTKTNNHSIDEMVRFTCPM